MKMTITEYAATQGVERNAIHKRIKKAKDKGIKPDLPNVTKIETVGNLTILHIKK